MTGLFTILLVGSMGLPYLRRAWSDVGGVFGVFILPVLVVCGATTLAAAFAALTGFAQACIVAGYFGIGGAVFAWERWAAGVAAREARKTRLAAARGRMRRPLPAIGPRSVAPVSAPPSLGPPP